jgi:hypothetical protein
LKIIVSLQPVESIEDSQNHSNKLNNLCEDDEYDSNYECVKSSQVSALNFADDDFVSIRLLFST